MVRWGILSLTILGVGCASSAQVAWLEAPGTAEVVAGVESATVSWSPVEGAEGYRLYLGRDPLTGPGSYDQLVQGDSPLDVELASGEPWWIAIQPYAGAARGSVSPALRVEPIVGGPNGLTPKSSPAWSMPDEQPGSLFGYPLVLGDVDGDDVTDLVTAAYYYTGVSSEEGRVFGYLGSQDVGIGGAADWFADGPIANGHYGTGLSLGDVNGDGVDDIVVGAADANDPSTGYADVHVGVPGSSPAVSGWSVQGPDGVSTNTGRFVSVAGDVDGDGFEDFVVASHGNGPDGEGEVYVFRGTDGALPASPTWTVRGEVGGDRFGWSLPDEPGDVNGDGHPDLLVGAFRADGNLTDEGAAYIFLSDGDGLVESAAWSVHSGVADAGLGHIVDWADVNGDGYDDVLVGAPEHTNATGAVFVYLGAAGGPASEPSWSFFGSATGSYTGDGLAGVGDLNGDGYDDVVVGSPGWDEGTDADVGRLDLFLGGPDGLTDQPQWSYVGTTPGGYFGGTIVGGSDVTGDSAADFIAGISGYFVINDGIAGIAAFGGPPSHGPALSAGGALAAVPGTPVSLSSPVVDASSCTVDWGDGSVPAEIAPCTGAELEALEHTYADSGRRIIRIDVADDEWGLTSSAFVVVSVAQ